jgi:hypothetical protein
MDCPTFSPLSCLGSSIAQLLYCSTFSFSPYYWVPFFFPFFLKFVHCLTFQLFWGSTLFNFPKFIYFQHSQLFQIQFSLVLFFIIMLVHIHSIYFIKFLWENSFGFYPFPNCIGFIHFPCCSTFPPTSIIQIFPTKVYPHFQISFSRCCIVSIFLHL